jgi:UDP-N-acetylmuramoyl-tripeptide--D-alanyl-D-alanine ligase
VRIKLGHSLSLKEIAKATDGTLPFNIDATIEYITTDSRNAEEGDLFIPIKGERFDGEDYVDEAIKRGCYIVSSRNNNAHIKTSDCSESLLRLASYYVKNLPNILYRIGITGSVGKTTTKEFARVLFKEYYKVHANEGNLNNSVGLPLSMLTTPYDSQVIVMEMGMNHKGEISRLSKCLMPNLAVITNIGTSHIGNLGSRDAIANAKMEIEDGMVGGKICVPTEEILLKNCKRKITASISNPHSDYYLESNGKLVSIYKNGINILKTNFIFAEKHLKKCLILACALAIESGISPECLSQGISRISTHNIRQRLIKAGDYLFWDDSYNASTESIIASLESIKGIETKGNKSILLGDVLELGDLSESQHRIIGEYFSEEIFDHIFLFGNYAKFTAEGAKSNGFPTDKIHINEDLDKPFISALQIKKFCKAGDLILLKGSRKTKVERILEYFPKGEVID